MTTDIELINPNTFTYSIKNYIYFLQYGVSESN